MSKSTEHCDYHGICKNKPYKEVWKVKRRTIWKGWWYLCRKHFEQEIKRGAKLAYCTAEY